MRRLFANKSVTFTSVFVLCITSWNLIRLYGAIIYWQILSEFSTNSKYILLSAIFWSFAGTGFLAHIWINRSVHLRTGLIIGLSYYLWYWADRFIIQSSPAPNFIFSAITTSLLLFFYIISLSIPTLKAHLNKE